MNNDVKIDIFIFAASKSNRMAAEQNQIFCISFCVYNISTSFCIFWRNISIEFDSALRL